MKHVLKHTHTLLAREVSYFSLCLSLTDSGSQGPQGVEVSGGRHGHRRFKEKAPHRCVTRSAPPPLPAAAHLPTRALQPAHAPPLARSARRRR